MTWRRSKWVVLVASTLGVSAGFVACGLDENGITSGDASLGDTGLADNGKDVVYDTFIPPTCATLDASCLGFDGGLPDGWIPVVFTGANGCPGTVNDFTALNYIENPTLTGGACACSDCIVGGSYGCSVVALSGMNGCNNAKAIAFNAPQCIVASGDHAQLSTQVFGNPSCGSADIGDGAVVPQNVNACRPSTCSTDYCGAADAGSLCLLSSDPSGTCPWPNFTPHVIGVPGSAVANCALCGCNLNAAGSCTGGLQVFAAAQVEGGSPSNCDGDGGTTAPDYKSTVMPNTGCQSVFQFDSLYWSPDAAPTPSCTQKVTNGTGTATIAPSGSLTLCCAN